MIPTAGHKWAQGEWQRRVVAWSLFPVIIASLLAVVYQGLTLSSAVRAYVAGESIWSKGQKEAVQHLYRFAMTRDETDYRRYTDALSVTMADRRARLELQGPHPNLNVAAYWFIKAENHPEDAWNMGMLFLRFGRVSYMREAIAIWVEGDRQIDTLDRVARELRGLVRSGVSDPERYRAVIDRISGVDERLTQLEADFSETLGEGARWMRRTFFLIVALVGALLVGIGTTVSTRLLDHARAVAELARRREEEFRALVEYSPDFISRLDRSARYTYVNPTVAQVTGIPVAEFLGRRYGELGCTSLRPEQWHPIVEHVFATGEAREVACEVSTPLGARSVHVRLTPMRGAAGTIESVLSVGRDVSELEASERALRDSQERLRQAQKMEAIGRLAGGIAHDFNNLLMVIEGSLDVALRQLPRDDGSAATLLVDARRAAERAEGLTRQLLTFSRQQVVQPCVMRLDTAVSEIQRMLGRFIGEDIKFVTELDPATPAIEADPGQIGQVILNLVINAREAMPHGGRLTIRTSAQRASAYEVPLVATEVDDGRRPVPSVWAVLEVVDTGVGMDPATKARMFEPFFTTRENGQGTGLGLSVVYGIVSQAGGHIEVESHPGRGTTLRVLLPGTTAPSAVPAEGHGGVLAPGSETVLVVEDEDSVRLLVREVLRQQGYTVFEASNGEEALEWVERHADDAGLALVISDVVMPLMGGRELVRELSRRGFQIPVIFMSGYTNDPAPLEDMAGEPAPFLSKPFRMDRLSEVVRRTLSHAAWSPAEPSGQVRGST